MNRSGWRSQLTALLTALITCIGLLSLSTAPAWAAAGTVTEFTVPSGTAFGITAGPDGNLWFTDRAASSIGRITTAGSVTEFRFGGSVWPMRAVRRLASRAGRMATCGLRKGRRIPRIPLGA